MTSDKKLIEQITTYLNAIKHAQTLDEAKREATLAVKLIQKGQGK